MGELLPNETLLRRYKELGGELITVGSDAHIPSDVGKDVDTACELLKEIGFRYITVYKNREPIQIKI
jgi:histidinol-phosphatase (PHP family)